MMIGCDLFAEDGQPRVAVALAEIAQDLVVGAILLDDVEHVLNGRSDPYFTGYDGRRGRRLGGHQLIVVVRRVVVYLFGPGAKVGLQLSEIDDFHAALLEALDRAVAFGTGRQR